MTPTQPTKPFPPRLADVRRAVRAACRAPENAFGRAFYVQHLAVVARHADALAVHLGADRRVVALASWLHDLAAVEDLGRLATHAADGARRARQLLSAAGWPGPVVEAVARCIETHGAPVAPGQGTPEEVCLSHADVTAQLARPAYWSWYLDRVRGLGQAEARAWFAARAGPSYAALVPQAQALAAGHRRAVLALLEGAAPARPLGAGGDLAPRTRPPRAG